MQPTTIDIDAILGTAEVAVILECPKQQIYALRKTHAFPTPVRVLAATPLWSAHDIHAFKASWKRRAKKAEVAPTEQV